MDTFFLQNSKKVLIAGFCLFIGCQCYRPAVKNQVIQEKDTQLLAELVGDTFYFGDKTKIHYSIRNLTTTTLILNDVKLSLIHATKFLYFPPSERMFREKLILELDSLTIRDSIFGNLILDIDSSFFEPYQNYLKLLLNGKKSIVKNSISSFQSESEEIDIYIVPKE